MQAQKGASELQENLERLESFLNMFYEFNTEDLGKVMLLKKNEKTSIDNILKFLQDVCKRHVSKEDAASNLVLKAYYNNAPIGVMGESRTWDELSPNEKMGNVFVFLGLVQKELKIKLQNEERGKIVYHTPKIIYTSIEEMLQKFPINDFLDEEERKKLKKDGTRDDLVSNDAFIVKVMKDAGYNIYLDVEAKEVWKRSVSREDIQKWYDNVLTDQQRKALNKYRDTDNPKIAFDVDTIYKTVNNGLSYVVGDENPFDGCLHQALIMSDIDSNSLLSICKRHIDKVFVPFNPKTGEPYTPTVVMGVLDITTIPSDIHWNDNDIENLGFEARFSTKQNIFHPNNVQRSMYRSLRGSIFLSENEWKEYGDTLEQCIIDAKLDSSNAYQSVQTLLDKIQKKMNDGKLPKFMMFSGAGCKFDEVQHEIQKTITNLGYQEDMAGVRFDPQDFGQILDMSLNDMSFSPLYSVGYLKEKANENGMVFETNGSGGNVYAPISYVGGKLQGMNDKDELGKFLIQKAEEYQNSYTKVNEDLRKMMQKKVEEVMQTDVKIADLLENPIVRAGIKKRANEMDVDIRGKNGVNILNKNYWLDAQDIRAIARSDEGRHYNISAHAFAGGGDDHQNVNRAEQELIDYVASLLNEDGGLETHPTKSFFVNTGHVKGKGLHWTSLTIGMHNGKITAFYKDSLRDGLPNQFIPPFLKKILRNNNIKLYNGRCSKQQKDGSACGLFAFGNIKSISNMIIDGRGKYDPVQQWEIPILRNEVREIYCNGTEKEFELANQINDYKDQRERMVSNFNNINVDQQIQIKLLVDGNDYKVIITDSADNACYKWCIGSVDDLQTAEGSQQINELLGFAIADIQQHIQNDTLNVLELHVPQEEAIAPQHEEQVGDAVMQVLQATLNELQKDSKLSCFTAEQVIETLTKAAEHKSFTNYVNSNPQGVDSNTLQLQKYFSGQFQKTAFFRTNEVLGKFDNQQNVMRKFVRDNWRAKEFGKVKNSKTAQL